MARGIETDEHGELSTRGKLCSGAVAGMCGQTVAVRSVSGGVLAGASVGFDANARPCSRTYVCASGTLPWLFVCAVSVRHRPTESASAEHEGPRGRAAALQGDDRLLSNDRAARRCHGLILGLMVRASPRGRRRASASSDIDASMRSSRSRRHCLLAPDSLQAQLSQVRPVSQHLFCHVRTLEAAAGRPPCITMRIAIGRGHQQPRLGLLRGSAIWPDRTTPRWFRWPCMAPGAREGRRTCVRDPFVGCGFWPYTPVNKHQRGVRTC